MKGSLGLRKGAWSKVENDLLRACVERYGEGKWNLVPMRAGLNRCRKSCRQRWLNYLKPNIKRGGFGEDEVDLMIRLHRLLGNRWSLIAGRLPGRTPNDVKNYWNTYIRKKQSSSSSSPKEDTANITAKPNGTAIMRPHEVIRPQPRSFSRTSPWLRTKLVGHQEGDHHDDESGAKEFSTVDDACAASSSECHKDWLGDKCWETLLEDKLLGINTENDTCYFGEQDGTSLKHPNWDEELKEVGDLLIEGQSWSDLLHYINLWDSRSQM